MLSTMLLISTLCETPMELVRLGRHDNQYESKSIPLRLDRLRDLHTLDDEAKANLNGVPVYPNLAFASSAKSDQSADEIAEQDQAIKTQLARRYTVDYHGVPLGDVLRDLHRKTGLAISVEPLLRKHGAYFIKRSITLTLVDRPLNDILTEVFSQCGASFTVREVTIQAHPYDASRALKAVDYPIDGIGIPNHRVVQLISTAFPEAEVRHVGSELTINVTAEASTHKRIATFLKLLSEGNARSPVASRTSPDVLSTKHHADETVLWFFQKLPSPVIKRFDWGEFKIDLAEPSVNRTNQWNLLTR